MGGLGGFIQAPRKGAGNRAVALVPGPRGGSRAAARTWAARSLVGRTTSALRECREPPPRPSLRIKGASGHTSVACMSAVQCPEVPLEYLLMGCLHRSDLIVITVRRHHLMQPAGL